MASLVVMWIAAWVIASEAGLCLDNQHCSDCDDTTGHCLTECDTGFFDLKCFSVCDGHCKGSLCNQSAGGSGRCTEGCEPGYQGQRCNIPCDSPGGNCTACPGGCDGGYCQLGSSCVSGCVDSYYGTDCEPGEDVGMVMGLSVSLAITPVPVIVIVVLAVCWCCRPLRRDRFQLYVTPTQDMHAPTENIDAPQYAVVDEAGIYDVPSCQGKPAYPSCSEYELGTIQTRHVS